jgi:hypothetical protein
MAISPELKAVYTTAPVARHYIETLSLEHENLTYVRWITNQAGGWTAKIEDATTQTFEYVPFAVIAPASEEEGAIRLQVVVDNADRVLMENLEALAATPTTPITLTYRVYLSDDTNIVQNEPMVLDITHVTASQFLISFEAGLENIRGRPFPSKLYTIDRYPGLSR